MIKELKLRICHCWINSTFRITGEFSLILLIHLQKRMGRMERRTPVLIKSFYIKPCLHAAFLVSQIIISTILFRISQLENSALPKEENIMYMVLLLIYAIWRYLPISQSQTSCKKKLVQFAAIIINVCNTCTFWWFELDLTCGFALMDIILLVMVRVS